MNVYQTFQVNFGPKIVAGAGVLKQLPFETKELGINKPLIVTDKGLIKAGLIEKITDVLRESNISFSIFDEIKTNPDNISVENGLKVFSEEGCDGLIAVGGGSPIDVAKSIGVLAANGGRISDYQGFGKFNNPITPLITIPTTVGTGSEVTLGAVITDVDSHVKMVIASPKMYASVAILEPALVQNLPGFITAATGMDALTHAIEGYISRGANPICDALNYKAISMIARSLRQAVTTDNIEHKYNMLLASCIAGLGFHNAGLGLVHAMASPISGHYGVHHGVANAILLPYVMKYNLYACPDRFAEIAEAMGENVSGMSLMEKAEIAIIAVTKLREDVGIPKTLSEVGVNPDESKLEIMVQDALDSIDLPSNPRKYSKDAIKELFKKAL
jgi:alcohol dehydrogenase class IV